MSPRALLFVTIFNSILGLSILFPILAPLGRELGLSVLQVGSLSASYALMQFLVSPFWGRLSERVGRKRVLLTGVLGFCVSFLGFALVADFGRRYAISTRALFLLLLASRALGGIFSSATLPTAQAYIADTTDRENRTAGMALVGAAFALGVIFGPLIGALLSKISLLAAVYASSLVALLNGGFVWLFLPESRRALPTTKPTGLSALAGTVWPLLAMGFVLSLASVAMEQTISFYYQDRLGLSGQATARTVGMALFVYGLVAVFAQGFLVRRYKWKPLSLLTLGLPSAFIGYLTLVFAERFSTLTLALAAQGFGQGLAMPGVTAALSLAVNDDDQGAVAGLGSSAQAFGRMLGPVIGTGLYELGKSYPYALSSVLLVLVMAVLAMNGRLQRTVNGHPDGLPQTRARTRP